MGVVSLASGGRDGARAAGVDLDPVPIKMLLSKLSNQSHDERLGRHAMRVVSGEKKYIININTFLATKVLVKTAPFV